MRFKSCSNAKGSDADVLGGVDDGFARTEEGTKEKVELVLDLGIEIGAPLVVPFVSAFFLAWG